MVEIIVNTEDLDHFFCEDLKESITSFLESEMQSLKEEESLKLDSLEKIVITHKFSEDVLKAQQGYGCKEKGYTNRENYTSPAKTIANKTDKKSLKQTIVIYEGIIVGMFSHQIDGYELEDSRYYYHVLHHEFCHVHDNFNQYEMFTEEGMVGAGLNELEQILITHANVIWNEYLAEKISSNSFPINKLYDLYIPNFLTLTEKCKESIDEKISRYRFSGDLNGLFIHLQEETSLLLKEMSKIQGCIHGLEIEEDDFSDTLKDNLDRLDLETIWTEQSDVLQELHEIYPKWDDRYQLKDLGQVVKRCWESFGVVPKYLEDKQSIHLDVPI